jgi:2-phosphosulfolactate phosphatase
MCLEIRHDHLSTTLSEGPQKGLRLLVSPLDGHTPAFSIFRINSPFEISGVDFRGKTIIQRTSAGTQGIVAASQAEWLYAASLVTAEATVSAFLSGSPDQISLVAMGENGLKRTDEVELCAIHLRNRLEGRSGDAYAVRRLILAGGEVERFHDPARPYLHSEDVDIALEIDRYDFAVRVKIEGGRPVARMERPA